MFRDRAMIPFWLVALGALAWFAAACGTGEPAMPLEPTAAADPAVWQTVYPLVTSANLNVVWGMDPDAMWAGGDDGTMLRWDGRQVTRVDFPGDDDITDIQGRAADDAWALAGEGLYHWDGRRWRLVHDLDGPITCFHCSAAGDLYVAGVALQDTLVTGFVRVLDDGIWRDMPTVSLTDRGVSHIWQPSPDHALMAAAGSWILRLVERAWLYGGHVGDDTGLRDVAGDLALTATWPWEGGRRLLQISPTGQVSEACPDQSFPDALALERSRRLLIATDDQLRAVDDCHTQPVASDIPTLVADLAVPQRAGAAGAAVFAVGTEGLFLEGRWQAAGGFAWRSLLPGPTNAIDGELDGNATLVVAKDGGELLIRDRDGWSTHAVGFTVYRHRVLDDGRIILSNGSTLAVRATDGTVSALPAPPFYLHEPWCDGERGWARDGHRLWRLDAGGWTVADTLGNHTPIHWLDARGPDEVYLATPFRLYRYDGHQFTDLTPEPVWDVYQVVLGRITGRLYLVGGVPGGGYTGVYADGQWTELHREGGGIFQLTATDLREITDELVIRVESGQLLRRDGDRWVLLEALDTPVRRVWGHPDQGLFVTTSDGRILHRTIPDLAP